MPHETLWRDWLRAARGSILAELAPTAQAAAGAAASGRLQDRPGNPGWMSRVWHGSERTPGAATACPDGPAIVCGQRLFMVRASAGTYAKLHLHMRRILTAPEATIMLRPLVLQVYIHPPPSFKRSPRGSVFADSIVPHRVKVHVFLPVGRATVLLTGSLSSCSTLSGLVEPSAKAVHPADRRQLCKPCRAQTSWGSHALVQAHRSLLSAALWHAGNAWFQLIGESVIPLYPPQLVSSCCRARLPPNAHCKIPIAKQLSTRRLHLYPPENFASAAHQVWREIVQANGSHVDTCEPLPVRPFDAHPPWLSLRQCRSQRARGGRTLRPVVRDTPLVDGVHLAHTVNVVEMLKCRLSGG